MHNQEEEQIRKGPWTVEEDLQLINHVAYYGEGRWDFAAKTAGLKRNGKSCRMRWVNYLRPDLKRGNITPQEEHLIVELQSRWGNRWSLIARRLPGRTDNEIKNYWRTRLKRRIHRPHNENQSSKCSAHSSFNPNPFLQPTSGLEFHGDPVAHVNEQPNLTVNKNIVIDFHEEMAKQESIDSIRVSNEINNLEECSAFVEGMTMPYEVGSYEAMLYELYGHVTQGGALSQFNGF